MLIKAGLLLKVDVVILSVFEIYLEAWFLSKHFNILCAAFFIFASIAVVFAITNILTKDASISALKLLCIVTTTTVGRRGL